MICWGCGGIGHGWRECATPRPNNNLLSNQKLPALSQHQPGGSTIIRQLREGWGAYEIEIPQS